MPEMTSYVPGTPCWVDVSSDDIEATAAFYGSLFGWDAMVMPDGGGYTMFLQDGKAVAAAGTSQSGAMPAWSTYIATANADATAASVKHAGGTVTAEPFDVNPGDRLKPVTTSAEAGNPGDRLKPVTTAGRYALSPAASSRERTMAAWIAFRNAARTPAISSSRIAAIVVPPGEVTISRNSTGCIFRSRICWAVPSIVWTTSWVEISRERPSRRPASIIASARSAK